MMMIENIYILIYKLINEYIERGIIWISKNNTENKTPLFCYTKDRSFVFNWLLILYFIYVDFLYGYMHILIMSSEDLSGIYWLKNHVFWIIFMFIICPNPLDLLNFILYQHIQLFHTPTYIYKISMHIIYRI